MDRWEYLVSREYKIRHHIAEYYFYDVDSIIDIGAYKFTIGGAYPYNVIPIDPLKTMFDSYHGTVSQWLNEHGDILTNNFGVMALGLEIEGGEDEWNAFKTLIGDSKIAILEHSIEHAPSVWQFEEIMKTTNKKLVTVIDFEFCSVPTPGFVNHTKRKMAILERN